MIPSLVVHPRRWRVAVLAVVPLASFLSFSVQPIVGKILVPWHGGAASTWIGAMLFFQTALMAGYVWAHWLGGRSLALQVRATVILAVVAAAATFLPPPRVLEGSGMLEVLLSLAIGLLLAMILLFSTGLMLHGWLGRLHGRVPYFLYAISNIGSFGALAMYPLWIEPHIGVGLQTRVWRGLLLVLALLLIVIARSLPRLSGLEAEDRRTQPSETIAPARKLAWLVLSALTCTCMLGATQHLSAEFGSNPLSWTIPLGLYLASFSLAFTGWWRPGATMASLGILVVSLTSFMLLKGVTADPLTLWSALCLIVVVGSACCFGNAALYALRPERDFQPFYVVIAAGGMIGGLFSSLSAPNLLPRNYEFIGAATALLAIGIAQMTASRRIASIAVAALVACAPVVGTAWKQQAAETTKFLRVHDVRNIYGHMQLVQQPGMIGLRSETTSHGVQVTQPCERTAEAPRSTTSRAAEWE